MKRINPQAEFILPQVLIVMDNEKSKFFSSIISVMDTWQFNIIGISNTGPSIQVQRIRIKNP